MFTTAELVFNMKWPNGRVCVHYYAAECHILNQSRTQRCWFLFRKFYGSHKEISNANVEFNYLRQVNEVNGGDNVFV